MKILPEVFTQQLMQQNQDACTRLDRLYSIRDQIEADGEWPAWCAMPMSEVMACLCAQNHTNVPNAFIVQQTAPLAAAYLWQKTKQVFKFDAMLRSELEKQPFSGDLPGDALLHLPVPCVYIDGMVDIFGQSVADGFFAWMEYDVSNRWKELRILALKESERSFSSLMLPIKGTIEESLAALQGSADFNAQTELGREIVQITDEIPISQSDNVRTFSCILNLLLYLCAEDPDYDKAPRHAKAKPVATLSTERPPRAPTITTAGVHVGAVIRKGYAAAGDEKNLKNTGSHTAKSPHIRRAHWHHYWTGTRGSSNQQLVLKWIPPVFVGSNTVHDVTIHPVK